MKKILLLLLLAGLNFSMSAQVIDLIGTGMHGSATENLTPASYENIDSVLLGVVYKNIEKAPDGDINYYDADNNVTVGFKSVSVKKDGGVGYPYIGTYTVQFAGADILGDNAHVVNTLDENSVHSFYAYVYRTIPNSPYYSVADTTSVFFYHNSSWYPYVYDIPILAVASPRDVTVKVPVSELDETDRMVIIEITAGTQTFTYQESTFNFGNSLFLGTYTIPNVPGDVDTISVSIYSPDPYVDFDENGNGMNGDSFVVSGIVVNVDNVPDQEEEPLCAECEGGINSLDLKYLGDDDDVTITIYEKKVQPEKVIATFTGVSPGDVISFVGLKENNKMGSKIRITIDDDDDYTEIHTSCSQDIYTGMVYDDLFEIMAGNSVDGGAICEYVPGSCGECEGQITYLELKYTGSSTADIRVYEGKVKASKLIAEFVGANAIAPDSSFSFVGMKKHNKMGAKIRITIDGDCGEYTEIHTSCSQDIYVGSTYDDLYEILDGTSWEGGPLCDIPDDDSDPECDECEGQITYLDLKYTGSSTADIRVYEGKVKPSKLIAEFVGANAIAPDGNFSFVGMKQHNKMGAKIRITIDGDCGEYTEIHTSCSQDIYVGSTYDDLYEILDGTSWEGGPLCDIPDDDSDPECDECEGQVTSLDLEYLGDEDGVTIKIYTKKVEPCKLFATFTNVNSGDTISFVGPNQGNKMGSKIRITIDGDNSNYTEIHTSCSQDIYVDMVYDDLYKITEGESHDGGPLCVDPNKSSMVTLRELEGMIIFPNPMAGLGTVEYVAANDGHAVIEIYDIVGSRVAVLFDGQVRADNTYQISLNASSLSKGIYVVVIKNESTTYKQKLLIAR